MIELTATKDHEGVTYEWDAIDTDTHRKVGIVLRDDRGTFYAQDLKADYAEFGDEWAAIAWLEAR